MNEGWLCPKCRKVLAPFVRECLCQQTFGEMTRRFIPYWCSACGLVHYDGICSKPTVTWYNTKIGDCY